MYTSTEHNGSGPFSHTDEDRSRLMTACLIISMFVKPLVSKPLCDNGLYEHWIAETKDFMCCREVNVSQGFEAVPCAEDGTEDRVQKCPNGTHQPDETSSRNSPHCIPDPTCTDLGIRKECFEGYCWPICICSLEHGKCGLNPLDCTDIKKIKCPGKVLEDCSCAPLVITSTLPTSSPSTSMNTTDLSKQSSISTLTSNPSTGSTSTVTTDRDDDTKYGSEKGNEWIYKGIAIGFSVLVVVAIATVCVYFKRTKNNRLKEAEELILIPLIGQDVAVNELNIKIPVSPKHTVTRQPSPGLPGFRLTDSLPEPVLPRPQPDNSNTDDTSEINNPHGSDSNQESVECEREVDDPEGRDFNHSSSADHGSEKADPSHQLNESEHRTAPGDPSVSDLSQGSSTDCRSVKADVNGHNLNHGSNTQCGVEALSYPSIKHTETSSLRVPPIGIVTPFIRPVQDNQSLPGSLGSSLRIDSLLSDNSIAVDEAGYTQPMEQIRELQSGNATPQTEANTLDQFQLCTKAAVSCNCGEQSGADPENTDMKIVSQNQSSEINTEAVDLENTLLMKAVKDEDLSSDLGQMTGAERTYTNINVKNKPKENSLARRNSINCRSVPTGDVQAELNKEPSQVMNSVCHTHGKSEQVLAGQNNSTQNQCHDINASYDKRLKVVKDAKSHELDTSQETHPVVNTQLPSFMSGDSLLQTESNNAQCMFPSSATQPGLTEENNFVGMSLHRRQENPTLDGLGMYTASGEKQWSTSRQSQHSSLSLAQEQSALEQIPPRSVSCPVLHSKFS